MAKERRYLQRIIPRANAFLGPKKTSNYHGTLVAQLLEVEKKIEGAHQSDPAQARHVVRDHRGVYGPVLSGFVVVVCRGGGLGGSPLSGPQMSVGGGALWSRPSMEVGQAGGVHGI